MPPDPHVVDLAEAERIVSGGLGVGGPEAWLNYRYWPTNWMPPGRTRVVADRGWLAAERFIGTTGRIVAPKLYIAFGVSGATQHVAGIGGSETIIAVNTDRTSPLLKLADLGVVGDLHQIVPILISKLVTYRDAKSIYRHGISQACRIQTTGIGPIVVPCLARK